MANYRQFTITNEARTESIALNDFNGFLATTPTGLGIYRESEYINIGNQRVATNNMQEFRKITLNVTILGERLTWEQKYANLRDFISRNLKNGFRLYYTPQDQTRYIKCDILIADKGEKDRGNLPIKLEIQPLTLWLDDVQVESVRKEVEGENLFEFKLNENLTDDYGRPWYSANFEPMNYVIEDRDVYAISFGSIASQLTTLNNTGTETTPLLIRIYGRAINPYITLRRYGSDLVEQSISFSGLTIESGYYLEVNSDPTDTHIELVDMATGERFDRASFADIDTNIYIQLPTGKWTIEITEESGEEECYAQIFFANQNYGG